MAKIRGRGKLGDVVKIDLGNERFGYGRVLASPLMAFYDLQSKEPLTATEVARAPILFVINVMHRAVKSEQWEIVGNEPLEDSLCVVPRFFMHDMFSKKFSIYHGGEITPAAREECLGLERAAVWEAFHVEDRLRNHFAGDLDPMTERLKVPKA